MKFLPLENKTGYTCVYANAFSINNEAFFADQLDNVAQKYHLSIQEIQTIRSALSENQYDINEHITTFHSWEHKLVVALVNENANTLLEIVQNLSCIKSSEVLDETPIFDYLWQNPSIDNEKILDIIVNLFPTKLLNVAMCSEYLDTALINKLLRKYGNSPKLLFALSHNPNITGKHIEQIFESVKELIALNKEKRIPFVDANQDIAYALYGIAGALNLSFRMMSELSQFPLLTTLEKIRCILAERADLPLYLLYSLSQDSNPIIRVSVAKNPDLSNAMKFNLAKDKSNLVRATIAERPDLSIELMRHMVSNPHETSEVLSKLAKRQDLPKELVSMLAGNQSPRVKSTIAQRADLSEDLITQLIKTSNEEVTLGGLALNPNLSTHHIEQLLSFKSTHINQLLAQRTDIDESILWNLAQSSPSPAVRGAIAVNPSISEDLILALYRYPDIRLELSQRDDLPDNIIQMLAKHENPAVRALIAQKKSLSPTLIKQLAYDSAYQVRMEIAKRNDLPIDILERLSQDNYWVAMQTLKHPNLPTYLVQRALYHPDSPIVSDTAMVFKWGYF